MKYIPNLVFRQVMPPVIAIIVSRCVSDVT